MTHLEIITAIEDYRLFTPSPIHVHSWAPRPLMAADQCVVCYGLREAENDYLIGRTDV